MDKQTQGEKQSERDKEGNKKWMIMHIQMTNVGNRFVMVEILNYYPFMISSYQHQEHALNKFLVLKQKLTYLGETRQVFKQGYTINFGCLYNA